MANSNTPQAEDLVSVGSRVSWQAILAGAAVALAMQFLFGVLAAAAGLSVGDRVDGETTRTSTIVLMIASVCISLFAGGIVTTQLTAGENKVEAAIYGMVMWATVTAIIAHGATAGHRSFGLAMNNVQSSSDWESAARTAGVPADQVQQWHTKLAENRKDSDSNSAELSSKARWYAFAGIWLSMFAAAGGALVGAGPTFRVVAVSRPLIRPTL